jgi:hypothetical protein
MTSFITNSKRAQLHDFINSITDEKLNEFYDKMEAELYELSTNQYYTNEYTSELNKRVEHYKKTGVSFSQEEVNIEMGELINKI